MLNDRVAKIIDDLIKIEGGYVDHPDDRGGPTNFGVTEVVARQYGFQGLMKDLTPGVAKEIYLQRFWSKPKFNLVMEVLPALAWEMFDHGVNAGPATPILHLQRMLNVFNHKGKFYPELLLDARIGKATLQSLRVFLDVRGTQGEKVLLKGMNCLQGHRYIALAESNQAFESFIYGWLANRVEI